MSEENTQATTETVSESPATETAQPSSNEQYIAESKKDRKRAQEAETRLAEMEKQFAKREEEKLKKKEEYKSLYEQASSKLESMTSNAEKWTQYEEKRRGSLLEKHPEDDRESLSKLDLDTLEYVTEKIINTKPNAPEVVGNPRGNVPKKDIDWGNKTDLKNNWADIINQYKKRPQKRKS